MSPTQATTISVTVSQVDALYVGGQISKDLEALSTAYPDKVSPTRALSLFNSYVTFLHNYAISWLGFSIHDPADGDLVYHEYRYEVQYGGEVRSAAGRGGRPVRKVWLPNSAIFTSWVIWSEHMKGLPVREQELIVQGTGWNIPGRNGTFNGRYIGGVWIGQGNYERGALRVGVSEYRYGG